MKQLPKYWYVLYKNEEEFNLINDFYKKDWNYTGNYSNKHGYGNFLDDRNNFIIISQDPDISTISTFSAKAIKELNAVEISFEDWEKLVLKENVIENENYDKLINILKFIQNYGKNK